MRVAREEDAEGIAEIYFPYVSTTPISFEIDPATAVEIRSRIEKTLHRYPWLVAEEEGRLIGYAYASAHRERAAYRFSVDVAAYVMQGFYRQGVARALYRELFRILKEQGYCNAFAGITVPNQASVGFHESFGFRPIGVYRNVGYKSGQWRDVGWWQLELAAPANPPRRLTDFPKIPVSGERSTLG